MPEPALYAVSIRGTKLASEIAMTKSLAFTRRLAHSHFHVASIARHAVLVAEKASVELPMTIK